MRRCEREREVAAGLRRGGLTAELSGHVAECASCAETERVARALLSGAAAMRGFDVPDVDLVWRRAQVRADEAALKRATRPLVVMRVLSAVFLVALVFWAAPEAWVLLRGHLPGAGDLGLVAAGGSMGLAGAVTSVVLIVAGAWCLLYAGRRGDVSGGYVDPPPIFKC